MKELFLSYLFKLRHDLTFKITLIIGGGLAVLMTLIYLGLGAILGEKIISGEQMLLGSLSPVQNFGLAVPINLITFTVLEFNQGSIRNKIIAGHSKASVYTSLFLNGLIFTFTLMILYVALCFGLGSIFGGFHPLGANGEYADMYIVKMIFIAVFTYVSIVAFTIFFSTLFRNIGPSIPVVIIVLLFAYLAGTIISSFISDNEALIWTMRIVDPLYGLGAGEREILGEQIIPLEDGSTMTYPIYGSAIVSNETFVSSILSNLMYAAIFFFGGLVIFVKRDIK